MSRPRVVLIEQDQRLGDMYLRMLEQRFSVIHARTAQEAIDAIDENGADAVITDVLLGSNNGIEIIHELRSYDDWTEIPILVLSSLPEHSFPGADGLWQRYNVSHFLFKPRTTPAKLMRTLSTVV